MREFFRALTITTTTIILLSIISCGNDDDDVQVEPVDEPAIEEQVKINLIATVPENEGAISVEGELRLVFDNPPKSVTVAGKAATVVDNIATIKIASLPDVTPGTMKTVIIEWKNPDDSVGGAKAIIFRILKPAVDGDDDDDGVKAPDFQSISPPAGSVVAGNQQFTITFSGVALRVTVNGTPTAPADGRIVTWRGNLPPGAVALSIAWEGGAGATAVYTVIAPDNTPPRVSGGSVKDGDKDIDPEPLNVDGITIQFTELVAKQSLKLTLEDGTDIGWLTKTDGNRVVFEPIKGRELGNETTFKIQGVVSDGAGNEVRISITFVTKGKE
jgi:hypothetical protein